MIRNKMKTAIIAPRIKRTIGMMPDELLINHIINAPESSESCLLKQGVAQHSIGDPLSCVNCCDPDHIHEREGNGKACFG